MTTQTIIRTRKKSFRLLILSMLPLLAFAATEPGGNWDLRYNKNGLSVYTQVIEDQPIKSFRAEMVADAPLDLVLSVIKNVQNYPDWFHLCRSYEIVEGTMSEGEYVGYYIVKAPWPLKDRDVYVQNKMSRDPETQIISILTHAVPEFEPARNEFTRVPEVYGRWTFKPINEKQTYIEFIGHGHPGGIIPLWIANMVVTDVPKKTFLNLRAVLEEKQSKQQHLMSNQAASPSFAAGRDGFWLIP